MQATIPIRYDQETLQEWVERFQSDAHSRMNKLVAGVPKSQWDIMEAQRDYHE